MFNIAEVSCFCSNVSVYLVFLMQRFVGMMSLHHIMSSKHGCGEYANLSDSQDHISDV